MTFQDYLNQLQHHLHQQLPFVAYRHPESEKLRLQLQPDDQLTYLTDFSVSGFVFAPFDSSKPTVLFPLDVARVHEAEVKSATISVDFTSDSPIPSDVNQQHAHEALVKKGIERIQTSALEKVVLSRKQRLTTAVEVELYFKRLLRQYPTAFVYCWYHPKVGMWMGATPETLVKTHRNRFSSMALAGTQAYKGSLSVSWGEKEKHEQAFVTDAMINGLQQLKGVNNLRFSEPQTVRAGNVLHIQTAISGRFEAAALGDIVKELHPTPAVCGLPREQAKKFILESEHYSREFYTGYLGELNVSSETHRNPRKRNVENSVFKSISKQSDLYVNLRCMQVFEESVAIYVGGGITKDSDAAAEWEETQRKAETMGKVL